MGRRLLAFASVAALLAVWIWANLPPDPSHAPAVAAPGEQRAPGVSATEAAPARGEPPADAPLGEPAGGSAGVTETSEAPIRTAVEPGPPVTIELVDLGGRAVHGASVWVRGVSNVRREVLAADLDRMLPRLEVEASPRFADADGAITFARPATAFQIVAATDDLAGARTAAGADAVRERRGTRPASGAKPLRLVLLPRGGWRARVVRSGNGSPVVGIPVATRVHSPVADQWPASLWAWEHPAVPTDAEGVAVVPLRNPFPLPEPERTSIGVLGVFEEPPKARIDLERTDGVQAHFAIPPTATLSIEVVDATGRPVRDARISVVPESMYARHPWLAYSELGGEPLAYPGMRNVLADDGAARVEHVELGLPIVVRVAVDGRRYPIDERLTFAGDETITITLPDARIEFTGLLRLADGTPHARQGVRWGFVTIPARERPSGQEPVRTDAEGRFRVVVGARGLPRAPTLAVLHLTRGKLAQGLLVDVRDRLTPGVHDLGTLQLERHEPLVAGRVVDRSGRPVERAEVELHPTGATRPRVRLHEGRPEGWLDDHSTAPLAVTGANGWFVVRGRPGWFHAWSVTVTGEGVEPLVDRRVALGRADLQLVVDREPAPPRGSVAGRVLLSEDVRARLGVWSGVEIGAVSSSGRRSTPALRDGRFEIQELEAGSWTIDVRPHGMFGVRARLEDVIVPADGPSTDPRLDPIDLRASLRALRVRAFDIGGEPTAGVWALPPEQRAHFALYAPVLGRGAECILLVGTDPVDMVVGAPGFLEQELSAVDGDRDVVLERALPVRIVWSNPIEAPPGKRFRPCLTRLEAGVQVEPCVWDDATAFDRNAESRWNTARPGEFRASLLLESVGSGSGSPLMSEDNPTVQVEDIAAEQQIEVSFDPDAVRAALERFSGR